MEVYLDGARQLTLQANVPTVGAALVELNGWLQRNGRALQTVSIDGSQVLAENLTMEIGAIPAAKVTRLDVTSARVVDLVIGALDEVQEVLPELPIACQSLAQVLSSDTPDEGVESLNQVLEIWIALQDRRRQIADALGLDPAAVTCDGRSLADRDEALAQTLAKIRSAQTTRDFGTIADLFAYDLFEFAEQEPAVFALFRERCVETG